MRERRVGLYCSWGKKDIEVECGGGVEPTARLILARHHNQVRRRKMPY